MFLRKHISWRVSYFWTQEKSEKIAFEEVLDIFLIVFLYVKIHHRSSEKLLKAPTLKNRFSPRNVQTGWNFQDMLDLKQIVFDKNFSPKYACLKKLLAEQWRKMPRFPTQTSCSFWWTIAKTLLFIRKSTSRRRVHHRPIFEKSIYKRKKVSTSLSPQKTAKNLHVNFLDDFIGA